MNKKMKSISILVYALIFSLIFTTSACQSDYDINNYSDDSSFTAAACMKSFASCIDSCMNKTIVVQDTDTISSRALQLAGTTKVYVNLANTNCAPDLTRIKTTQQIMDDIIAKGASLSLIQPNSNYDLLYLSDWECANATKDMIPDCKRYLYSKGLTDSEILTMLDEEGCDESLLIPFVLTLTEEEIIQTKSNNSSCSRNTETEKLKRCAWHALGADILAAAYQSTTKVWTKVVLKRLLKTIASKVVGPVGVIVFIADFSSCYFN